MARVFSWAGEASGCCAMSCTRVLSGGHGLTLTFHSHQAALNILKLLSELDQQNTEMPRTGNGPMSV